MRALLIILLSLSGPTLYAADWTIQESLWQGGADSATLADAIENIDQFEPIGRSNLGMVPHDVWVKLEITNHTNEPATQRLYNQRFGLDFIDVFVMRNGQLFKHYQLGDSRPYEERDNHFRAPYFDVDLLPGEQADIFIKQSTYTSMEARWNAIDIDAFNAFFSIQNMIYFSLLGMLLVATLASLGLFFLLRYRYFLIYSLFVISSIIYQFSLAGYFYQFRLPLYFNTISSYAVSELAVVMLGLFPFSFFALKRSDYRPLTTIIKGILIFKGFVILGYLLYPLNNDLLYTAKYSSITSVFLMFALLALSIRAYADKKPGAGFYLLANMLLSGSAVYFVLGLQGLIPTSTLYYYSLSIGIVAQDFLLAFALIYATYKIKKDRDNQRELIDEYSKLTFLGQTVINIYHQWKAPVNNIYNSINHIESAREFRDPDLSTVIDDNLEKIKNNTSYLKDTALNYLEHYKSIDKPPTQVNIREEISSVVQLLKLEMEKINLHVSIDAPEELTLSLQKNHFTNLMMILLENALNQFKLRRTPRPKISISVKQQKDFVVIKVGDNAGGFVEENVDTIFERSHSASSSTGIGLYLAREFLLPKLHGSITADKCDQGACFTIALQTD